jgi:hypothetical protein
MKKFPLSTIIIMGLVLLVSCSTIPAALGTSIIPGTPGTTEITEYIFTDYITASSIAELSQKASFIIIGQVVEIDGIINMARDVNDKTKPDPSLLGVGQIYQLKVEEYLKGVEGANGDNMVYVIQSEGFLEITPGAAITDEEIQKARKQENYVPMRKNTKYLLFLEPLTGFPELKNSYVGVAHPWRFDVSNPDALVPESSWNRASQIFGTKTLADVLEQIKNPELYINQPYPPPPTPRTTTYP